MIKEGWEMLEETVNNVDNHIYPWSGTFLRDILKEYEIVIEVGHDKVYTYNIMNIPFPFSFPPSKSRPLTIKGDGIYHKGYSYEVTLRYLTDGKGPNNNNTWKVIDIIPLGEHYE